MSELDAARREALAGALRADQRYMTDSPEGLADALAPLIAGWVAAAEQRGREDNADHGMCYVHGSQALEARLAEAKGEALREAADAWTQGGWAEAIPRDRANTTEQETDHA